MIRRVGKYLLLATALAGFAVLGVMAFMRRDHKVELVVTYQASNRAVRLDRDHRRRPLRWLSVRLDHL
jgi:hypothetical protein